jgi:hypothetical protein
VSDVGDNGGQVLERARREYSPTWATKLPVIHASVLIGSARFAWSH